MLGAHRSLVLLLCAALLTISGCASSQVRLRYVPADKLPAVQTQHHANIGLVQFTDTRPTQVLGIDQGKELAPVSNVAAWVTRGLENELVRQGAAVTYVISPDQIKTLPTRVTGTITQLQVTPLSAMEYRGELTLTIAINDDLPTTYKATVVKQGVPYTNIIEPLLAELLQEAITPAIPTIFATQ
ncbi:YajG family lipoprotein [Halodesulfovibrio marinisediminis]|uniref:Lipoprotein n=1 Tax=Halodesulfovibrio marinisediminis DSM 17456 TaxID=1121457 RepID=A0A1N6FZU1_9BACT|nr:hypothetical protein [Halodesulfovibrio marinisediminis]SIO00819.1 hypothetical protein SAMN02745161_1605 [Halodesulfovibrio marinisediminis DSM 17456]